ncbi:type II/IV secretion system protein [Candidatus Uhrbacteria bacterium]|nr:type II/IV secretion system protein [Candidatus Uhrbacteria bacterium]
MQNDGHIKELTPKDAAEGFAVKMHDIKLKQLEDQAQSFASSIQMPYISLVGMPIPPGPLSIISEEDAAEFKAVCFAESPEEKRIALVDPSIAGLEDFLKGVEDRLHSRLALFIMSDASFQACMKLYGQLPKITPPVAGVSIREEDLAKFSEEFSDIRKIQEQIQNVSLTEMLALFIAVALKTRASDIHVEAEEHDVRARLRIDGTLQDIATLPHEAWHKIISRIKLVSKLKINVANRPQDGRFTIFLKDEEIDVRVSTLPTSYGESVVMRLLRSSATGFAFDALGLSGYSYALLKNEIDKPNGMIITTGPTGSGKTTTMYAILNYLNSPEIKIITIEDPVEYKLKGLNQSQIDPSKNYTFASGLRSILRQDPDVVMVGEIRDIETADIAINAALTGHLVLSTIHTNSAAGAIPRFLAMGVKQYLLAPSLNAIMGQRLVRRLCQECKVEDTLDAEKRERVTRELSTITEKARANIDLSNLHVWKSTGCEACHGIGFKGRIGIYEIMAMSPEIEKLINADDVSEYTIRDTAVAAGMVTMVQDGLLRALEGTTSVAEVFSVAE